MKLFVRLMFLVLAVSATGSVLRTGTAMAAPSQSGCEHMHDHEDGKWDSYCDANGGQ